MKMAKRALTAVLVLLALVAGLVFVLKDKITLGA